MKLSHRYEQTSCRLRIDGLPDLSAGHGQDVIGILSAWELDLAGHPTLEGKRDHLQALMTAVLPYARHLVSSVPRPMGAATDPVQMEPIPAAKPGIRNRPAHRLRLHSSQPDTQPLELSFDDAELADLVRCLDQLRLDPRVRLGFDLPPDRPLQRREILERVPLRQRLAAPAAGLAALAITTALGLMVPLPRRTAPPAASPEATPTTPLSPPPR
ncbi:DUF4335 domain-containing protein [Synechococcus sp. BSF8S]|uniref:DUF4335 domain-containing protein n=1 Tax=Synechococcales TaxID=1890424 RepID=UPI001627D417|nr:MULTISPECIES: DUF4335 domain-containing protein [unclassified Synechococcus]MBC1261429.1 DUF4335 domain-containing protein [Synechococcus sp. BSF8S]MBC1264459.1 DUF4335 domain-containing protein [Synechococcus sp. BSA11S]